MGDLDRQVPFPGRGLPRPKDRDVARLNDPLLPVRLAFATHQHAPLAVNHHEETVDGGTADHRGLIAKLAKEDAAAAISSAIAFRNNFAGRVDVKLFRSNTARVGRGDGWRCSHCNWNISPFGTHTGRCHSKKRDVTQPRCSPRTDAGRWIRAAFVTPSEGFGRAKKGKESCLIRGELIARVRTSRRAITPAACPDAIGRRRSWRRQSPLACGFRRRAFAGLQRRAP